MAPRYFTLEEANRAVGELRPVAERMVEHRRRFVAAQQRRGALAEQAGSNGGDLTPGERIQSAGAQVKDLDAGLLDFPSLRDGEEILLCWRLGEDEIEFWHGPEEGFAGRKRV